MFHRRRPKKPSGPDLSYGTRGLHLRQQAAGLGEREGEAEADHPIYVPGPNIEVRWLRHEDGRCHGKEYYDATPACRTALAAQAAHVADKGRVAKSPRNGHQLEGEFRDLYELKPGDYRFIGFRHLNTFYISNGAKKEKRKKQERDYRFALAARDAFFKKLQDRIPRQEK